MVSGSKDRTIGEIGRLVLLLVGFIGCVIFTAGAGDIRWLATTYDFGTFRESSGVQTGFVRFVNQDTVPTIINRVRPSCGCTGATHTQGLIMPGDTAVVSFSYDPSGRPGPFSKTIKVYTGQANELNVIKITGTVIGTRVTLEKDYPYSAGGLRLSETLVDGGEVKYGSSRHTFVRLYNESEQPVRPQIIESTKGLDANIVVPVIEPGTVGTLCLALDTRSVGPGSYKGRIVLKSDSIAARGDTLTVDYMAEVKPYSPALTPQEIEEGPQCVIKRSVVDLGHVKKNRKEVGFHFEVCNEGKRPLTVRNVISTDDRVKITSFPRFLGGKRRGEINGKYIIGNSKDEEQSNGECGPFRIAVEVFSDDLLHPVRIVNLVGIRQCGSIVSNP